MTHPLIARLTTEIGWPSLSHAGDVTEFTGRPGVHCLFVPGDPAIDYKAVEAAGVFKTPLLIFFRDGAQIGTIPKVRDWDDYLNRVAHILTLTPEGAA